MRVISGKYRGRKLIAPIGENTRPTLDRTKETIFNIIQHDIAESNCLDLFAGSGQIGIELLSRGANHVTFVDNNRASNKCIVDNLNSLSVDNSQYSVYNANYQVVTTLKGRYNLVYLDPPFGLDNYVEVITLLAGNGVLADDAIIVCESALNNSLPDSVSGFALVKQRKVGKVLFTIYQGEE